MGLMPRERLIVLSLQKGVTAKQIVKKFEMSERTLSFYLTNILRKLQFDSLNELIRQAQV